jgi:hypothetical protein
VAALAMLVGAAVGGLLVLTVGVATALGLVTALLLLVVAVAHRLLSSLAACLSAK